MCRRGPLNLWPPETVLPSLSRVPYAKRDTRLYVLEETSWKRTFDWIHWIISVSCLYLLWVILFPSLFFCLFFPFFLMTFPILVSFWKYMLEKLYRLLSWLFNFRWKGGYSGDWSTILIFSYILILLPLLVCYFYLFSLSPCLTVFFFQTNILHDILYFLKERRKK